MKVQNKNYCGTVVIINKLVPIENSDNIQHAIIMGNSVIVGKDVKIGDKGIYFPLETQLSAEYISKNNLYRDATLNDDNTKKGYFELNGRIRCVKLRGNKSEGLFMPITSISFFTDIELPEGEEFDELDGIRICKKYIPKGNRTPGMPGSKKGKGRLAKESKLIEGQFKFHDDTTMLYKNIHRFNPDTLIHISYKLHGTSFISSKLLCKRKLPWYEKLLKKVGISINDSEYDYIYASRKVIKNSELNPDANHFYNEDIWKLAHLQIKDFLQKGMTVYGEVVGYMPSGGSIQKSYDYGCCAGQYDVYIYRITYTNPDGKVYEFTGKQVQDWCRKNDLNPVPELYYGTVAQFITYAEGVLNKETRIFDLQNEQNEISEYFLELVKEMYNEKSCFMCVHQVPEEGCVVRREGLEFEAYKQKSNAFYERETKLLDKGESNIEDEN